MSTTLETRPFEAEVQQVLDLVIHSLYQNRDIFLRELLSNASDALDKLRFETLRDPQLEGAGDELEIGLEPDPEARTLAIVDNGIGMSREELVEHLGTIAGSGTRRFLERVRESGGDALPELIGRFGVGFYSAFMVAGEVVVETRRAGEKQGWRWRSAGDGQYSLEPAEGLPRGTRVTLHLREKQELGRDFTDAAVLREIVQRYSDFLEYPIRLRAEGEDEPETLNSMKPLWARPKEEIDEQKYRELYRHLTHELDDPLETIHFRAEGTLEYDALLFLPSRRSLDLFESTRPRSRISLHVRRVLIDPECEQLLPPWLRFVRGVVDCNDLPLNVSRETLQENPLVPKIRRRLVRKVLNTLEQMLAEDRPRYERFWREFGVVLKEGVYAGAEESERLEKLLLFESTHEGGLTTLAEYVERMAPDQPAIWFVSGASREVLADCPHLEAFRARGQEVLLFTDPVDDFMLGRLGEFEGKPLRPAHAGAFPLESDEDRRALEDEACAHADVLERASERLGEAVAEVRFTHRLVESPAALVTLEGSPPPHVARLLEASGASAPPPRRALELNPAHPLVRRLCSLVGDDRERFGELVELLHAQALLAEGSPLPSPARFSRLLSRWLTGAESAPTDAVQSPEADAPDDAPEADGGPQAQDGA